MSETSALQGLSRLLLAHQDSESGAEVMRETRETGLHLARPASQSLPQGRGGESLDQEQKSHIAARVSLQLFLDAERFVVTPEIAANKTTLRSHRAAAVTHGSRQSPRTEQAGEGDSSREPAPLVWMETHGNWRGAPTR